MGNKIDSALSDVKTEESPINLVMNELRVFSIWTISALIDAVFLIAWVVVQWLSDQLANLLISRGFSPITLDVFQVLFAIATLIPIVFFVIKDLYTVIMRVRTEIVGNPERRTTLEQDITNDRLIQLEYRALELEGILEWAVANDVSIKEIPLEQLRKIQQKALAQVKKRYPDVQVEVKGQ